MSNVVWWFRALFGRSTSLTREGFGDARAIIADRLVRLAWRVHFSQAEITAHELEQRARRQSR